MIIYGYVIIPGAQQGQKSSISQEAAHFARYHLPFCTLSFSVITTAAAAAAAALPEVIQTQTSTPAPGLGAKMKSILPKRCVSEDSMRASGRAVADPSSEL